MKNIVLFAIALLLPTFGASAKEVELSDAQILAILIAANKADIATGKLAKFKSSDREVDFFARRMILDHGDNLDSVASYLKRKKYNRRKIPPAWNLWNMEKRLLKT